MNKTELKDRSLPEVAKHFLEQQGDFTKEIIGTYDKQDSVISHSKEPLYRYLWEDGGVGEEYVQFVIPCSGLPSYLLGLKTVDTDIGWVKKPWMEAF